MKIVVTGLIAQYPIGGVTWDYIQYPIGLARLGHDVTYLEDSGCWPYDVETDGTTTDPTASIRYLARVMKRFGLANRWSYRLVLTGGREVHYGLSKKAVAARLAESDLFLNVSGASFIREPHLAARRRVYIDSDPGSVQLDAALGRPERLASLSQYHLHFSFGELIGSAECPLPSGPFRWRPTRQPIVLDLWPVAPPPPPEAPFTTVMNWTSYETVEYDGRRYGQKDVEFLKILDLPARCPAEHFTPAIGGGRSARRPDRLLREHGWDFVDSRAVSATPDHYRDFLARSKGEFSVAKEAYVVGQSGWFSCRSACYLALGRPVVLQDTGYSRVLPSGQGILPFDDLDGAAEAVRAVSHDYAAHSSAARRLAEEAFDSSTVLSRLLAEATT
ncbi:MAG TPA: glycosyltransferase family 1 protein [Methylomirabilota bacterium]|jgi:hypothetical protein|nr:glycosyltransferase family 1 protein [Methylomirabilota bacterium]